MSEWSSRTPRADFAFAVLAIVLVVVAIVPLASVGFAESCFLSALLALVGVGFLFPDRGKTAAPPAAPVWWGRVFGLLLLLWALVQLVPFLPGWGIPLRLCWRGPVDLWESIAANAGHSLSVAVAPHGAVRLLLLYVSLVLVAAAASRRLFHAKPRFLFLGCLVLVASVEALWGILAKDPLSGRAHGHFANADAFGGLFVMTLPVTLGLVLASTLKEWGRGELTFSRVSSGRVRLWSVLLLAGAFLLQWAAIFGSGSRGSALVAFLACAVLLAGAAVGRPRLRRVLLWLLPLVAVAAIAFNCNAMRESVVNRVQGRAVAEAALPRLPIWQAAVRFVRDFPAGAGLGGMESFLSHYQDGSVHGAYALNFAHNDTLQFFGDLGIPGIAILGGLLCLLLVRTLRACRPRGDRHPVRREASPWVLRGVAAGVGGALLHAQVEFNLSARPPLQLVFLTLAAILVSAGRPNRQQTASPPRVTLPSAIALSVVALAVAVVSTMMGTSYLLARSVATAAEMPVPPTDSALASSLVVPVSDASVATNRLALADSLDPFSPLVPVARATWELASQREVLEQAAAQFAPDEEPSAEMLSRLSSLVRPEEIVHIDAALRAADIAVMRAPWNPRPLTLRAWILLRGDAIDAFGDAVADPAGRALDDLRLAVALSPDDSVILESAAQAFLFTVDRSPEDLERLFGVGSKIIALNPRLTDDVLELWWSAGAPLERIFSLDHLPTSCLWNLYRLAGQTAPELRAPILDRIESSLADPALYPVSLPDVPWLPSSADAADSILRHRARLAGERLLLAARAGDLASIRASSSARAMLRLETGRQQVDKALSVGVSSQIRNASLRHLFERHVLPAALQLDVAIRLFPDSPKASSILSVLRDAASLGDISSEQLAVLESQFVPPRLPSPVSDIPAPVPDALQIPYRGETVWLDAVEFSTNPCMARATFRLRATELPSTLGVVFTVHDPDQRLLASKSVEFDKASPDFHKGNPRFDTLYVLEAPLRHAACLADTLQVTLRASPEQPIFPDDVNHHLVFSASGVMVDLAAQGQDAESVADANAAPLPAPDNLAEIPSLPVVLPKPEPVPVAAPPPPPAPPRMSIDDDPELREALVELPPLDDPELDAELLDFFVTDSDAAPMGASNSTSNVSLP